MRVISGLFLMVCLAVNTVTAAELTTGKSAYSPGEMVTLTFSGGSSAKDWLAMYNSTTTPAVKNNLSWLYLNGTESVPSKAMTLGSVRFRAPLKSGKYKFCLHHNDGYSVMATTYFSVKQQAFTTNKSTYKPGEIVKVIFSKGHLAKDWVGMYSSSTIPAVKNSLNWSYLNGTRTIPSKAIASGMLQFKAPRCAGKYKCCFHPNEAYTVENTAYFSVQQSASRSQASRQGISPVTQFTSDMTSIREGSSISFIDLSKNNPTAWSWHFEGGTPATSHTKKPIVTYRQSGIYSVTLTTTNSAGDNRVAKKGYITVAEDGEATYLKCLQFNVWKEGTSVKNGMAYIRDVVAAVNPDVVGFSEVYNYKGQDWTEKIIKELAALGLTYYRGYVEGTTSIISKFPITSSKQVSATTVFSIDVYGTDVMVASARLDGHHYACYLPRGLRCCGSAPKYDGWGALTAPITDTAIIYHENLGSQRDEQIASFINFVKDEKRPIILLGDFNEPSHLDWTENQANMFGHHGVVYQWTTTLALANNSFTDAYRKIHPDEVKYPGISWPSTVKGNANTTWLKGDKRDRINYIFYRGNGVRVTKVAIVGPKTSYVGDTESSSHTGYEDFLASKMPWPSDHKGIWANIVIPGTR